jgi:hypothetical protein
MSPAKNHPTPGGFSEASLDALDARWRPSGKDLPPREANGRKSTNGISSPSKGLMKLVTLEMQLVTLEVYISQYQSCHCVYWFVDFLKWRGWKCA